MWKLCLAFLFCLPIVFADNECPPDKSIVHKIQKRVNKLLVDPWNNNKTDKFGKMLTDDAQVMITGKPTATGKSDALQAIMDTLDELTQHHHIRIRMPVIEAVMVSHEHAFARTRIRNLADDGTESGNTRVIAILAKKRSRWVISRMLVNTW